MWRPAQACGILFLMSAHYSVVMWGAWPGTLATWPWLRLSMICWCALRLWSQICITYRSCWFPDLVTLSRYSGARGLEPEGWLHTLQMFTEHFAYPNLSVVVAKCWFLRFGVRYNLYVFSLYCIPDQDDQIFDCLLASMATCHCGYQCLFPVCKWFEWPSSGVVGWNAWPSDDWCSWPTV